MKVIFKSIVHQLHLILCLRIKKVSKFWFFPWSPNEMDTFDPILLVSYCGLFLGSNKPLRIRLLPPVASFYYLSNTAIIIADTNTKFKALDTLCLRLYIKVFLVYYLIKLLLDCLIYIVYEFWLSYLNQIDWLPINLRYWYLKVFQQINSWKLVISCLFF